MNSLQQRLKEMSKEDFESLIDQLLQSKYRTAGIKRVDGSGGDEGIDCFEGNLSDGPSVWQVKHFPNRIQKAQRKQIVNAIKSAFAQRTPRRWALYLPINLRTSEHNWFQNDVKAIYERKYPGTTIELFQASNILHDLLHAKTIREAFFPSSVPDIARLKKLVVGSEGLTGGQQAEVAQEYAQQYLESLKEIEPRCSYEVTFGDGNGQQLRIAQGAMLSIHESDRITRVYPRDLDALRLAPPKLKMTLRSTAVEKLRFALDTGRPQILVPGEVVSIDEVWALLGSMKDTASQAEIHIKPTIPSYPPVPLRVRFGGEANVREISYWPFAIEYIGQREVTLRSIGKLPLEIRMVLGKNGQTSSIQLETNFGGADVLKIDEAMQCLSMLETTPTIEISSVEHEREILTCHIEGLKYGEGKDTFAALIRDAAIVARHFDVKLHLPDEISAKDRECLQTLKRIATSEEFSAVTLATSMTKQTEYSKVVLETLAASSRVLRVEGESDWRLELFGTSVIVPPTVFVCSKAVIVGSDEIRKAYLAASEGEPVKFIWECTGQCRFFYKS